MRSAMALGVGGMLLVLTGCPKDNESSEPVTYDEAKQSLEESSVSSQAGDLTASSIELSTNFTIGKAAAAAADELKTFIVTQLPCADISLANTKLTVNYGAKAGNCIYHGHTFHGTHTIEVTRSDDSVEVEHTWTSFTNGVVTVNGSATVTWSKAQASRRVQHELTWTRNTDGLEGKGTGDRTEKALPGGITEGFQIDGSRTWDGKRGHWDLGIAGVQMRWADPVPQAGTYTLVTPKKKTLSVSFERVDADRIRVTLASGDKSFKFVVARKGDVSDA